MEVLDMGPSTNRITLRLSNSILAELRKESDERDLPISSIISKILGKYISFDRRFKSILTISMSQGLFTTIIENLDEAKIEKIAEDGPKVVQKLCHLSQWKYDIDSVIDNYFITLSKYGGWFRFTHKINHQNYTLIFETSLGKRWAQFLTVYVRSILDSMKIRIDDVSVNDDVIIFKFVKK